MSDIQLEINHYIKNLQKKKYISENDDYTFKFAYTDENEHYVDIYKKDNMLIRATYEILGCYNIVSSMWVWGWAVSHIERNLTEKTKNKASDLRTFLQNGKITKDVEEYLYYLSNSSFFISYKSIDKILNLGLYMTKNQYIFAHKIDENKPKIIEFILIKKITQEHMYKN